nr:BrnT family toxin [Polymorphobacter sp.]
MFEYDPAKSVVNRSKHGIDFHEAQAIWNDDTALRIEAHDGPDGEARWLVIGRIGDKTWSAAVTYRAATTRIISVRRARKDEEQLYDDQKL